MNSDKTIYEFGSTQGYLCIFDIKNEGSSKLRELLLFGKKKRLKRETN